MLSSLLGPGYSHSAGNRSQYVLQKIRCYVQKAYRPQLFGLLFPHEDVRWFSESPLTVICRHNRALSTCYFKPGNKFEILISISEIRHCVKAWNWNMIFEKSTLM